MKRYAGGIYRCKDFAQSMCRSPKTVCAFVVWDQDKARTFFENAIRHNWLDESSVRDMTYYFGTEVSRKLMRRNDG